MEDKTKNENLARWLKETEIKPLSHRERLEREIEILKARWGKKDSHQAETAKKV